MVTGRSGWQAAHGAQVDLWRWMEQDTGRRWMMRAHEVASRPLSPSSKLLIRGLYNTEPSKLLLASPVFVAEEMVDLVEAAAATFQPEPLMESDLLTREAFVWFERPIVIPDRFDEPLLLRGFSWCPAYTSNTVRPEDAASVETDGKDGTTLIAYGGVEGQQEERGVALTLYADHPGIPGIGFAPTHLTPWWFGMSFDGNEEDENGKATGAEWWWRIVQACLRLMQQRIAHRANERPGRPARREALRHGFIDHDVIVVRLRKERGEHHESGGTANYSHRFIVDGHWRNQWYPSGQVHRQIWISPYVKGPDELPLVIAPNRAYTWTR